MMKGALSAFPSFAFCLFTFDFLKIATAGIVPAVAVNLDVVLGALAVDAAKLLALLDGAGAGRVPARVLVLHGDIARGLVGHLGVPPAPVQGLKKGNSVLCQIARRVKE
jgi:hypothetical protein